MIFNLFIKFFLLTLLIFLSIFSLSLSDLISLWFFLEMTNFLFICLMCLNLNNKKIIFFYYLIQFISSFFLIFSIITMNFLFKFNFYFLILILTLSIKLIIPPFHFWMIIMSNYINWQNLFILITIQKIIPFYFMSFYYFNSFLLNFMIMFCMIIPPIMSMNILKYKKLLIYSSINQSGWMLLLITFKNLIWLTYFFYYSMLLFLLIYLIKLLKMNYNFFILFYNFNKNFLMIMYLMMFNMISIPPFTFFIFKWYSIFIFLMNSNFYTILIMMMISSFIMLYIYINMMMISMFLWINSSKMLNIYKINLNYFQYLIIFYIFFLIIFLFMNYE